MILFTVFALNACAPVSSLDPGAASLGATAEGKVAESDCKTCGGDHKPPITRAGTGADFPDLEGTWSAQNAEAVVAWSDATGHFDFTMDLMEEEGIWYAFDGSGQVGASDVFTATGDVIVLYPDGSTEQSSSAQVLRGEYSSDKDILEATLSFTGGFTSGSGVSVSLER